MRILRLVDEYRALSQESAVLADEVASSEREARHDLATSAARFTERTQRVLDDKLSFSATLARAGEQEAAKRMLAEVADDLAAEEMVLVERVNEVRVARAVQKDRLTRARLLKTVVAAMLGALVVVVGAMGFAVASMFHEDDGVSVATQPHASSVAAAPKDASVIRTVTVGGHVLRLTKREHKLLEVLTSGPIDEARLERFLLSVVGDPAVAEDITLALAGLLDEVEPVADTLVGAIEGVEAPRTENTAADEPQASDDAAQKKEPDRREKRSGGGGPEADPGGGTGGEGRLKLPDPDDLLPVD